MLIVVELKFLYNKIASYLAVFKINEYFCKLLESIKTNYYDRSPEKVNEVVVLEKTHNSETILIKNPSEKLLAFMEELEQRKKKLKKEIRATKNKEYIKI